MFELAFTQTDTFIKLRDPADSTRILGAFFWGTGKEKKQGFVRLKNRNKVVALSAVFVGMMEALKSENRIIAVDNSGYITSKRTNTRIAEGKVISVAASGNLQSEKIFKLQPDLILGYFIDAKGKSELDQLNSKGIPVLYIQNFLENHPLGRAEWICLFGALCGHWEMAQAQFREIEEHYLSTAIRASEVKWKPSVLCNAPFSGIWDVPSGESFMAKLIEDAGGAYVFTQYRGAGRIPMDIEKVYKTGSNAIFWLNPGPCRDTTCLEQIDSRLKNFKAFNTGNIYNSTRMQNKNGANAWWEYGVLRPDLALLDIFTILHPEVANEHELVFFEKLN